MDAAFESEGLDVERFWKALRSLPDDVFKKVYAAQREKFNLQIDDVREKKIVIWQMVESISSFRSIYGAQLVYIPYVRKQMMRPSMSWPLDPGSKKTGMPTNVILRTDSKISNQ